MPVNKGRSTLTKNLLISQEKSTELFILIKNKIQLFVIWDAKDIRPSEFHAGEKVQSKKEDNKEREQREAGAMLSMYIYNYSF